MQRTQSFSALVASAVLLSAALATPSLARTSPAPATVIPLETYVDQDHYVFRATVNGHAGVYQIDTGGGLTIVTPQTVAAAGCKPWGRLTGFRMKGDRLDVQRCDNLTLNVGGLTLKAPATGIWDLASAGLPKDAPPLAGSVGLDAFGGHTVTLDLAHKRLIVETPRSAAAREAAAHEVPMHFVHEVEGYSVTVMVPVDTASGRIWMTLDSGDDTPITIGRHVAALLKLDPQHHGRQPLDATLAGGVPLSGNAYVQDITYDGNIGAPALRQWIVTLDLARGRLWIAPAGKD